MNESAGRPQQFLPLWLLQGVTLYWIALKLGALFIGEPHADEAYYWFWGQHLALSYFDHPGLHAWLQAGAAALFGWSLFALRFLSIVTTAITLYILYLWARRLAPAQWKPYFWLSAALFYSTPTMLLYTTVAILDRLLVALILLTIHFFAWFLADWSEGKRDRYLALYLGAFFLGLAALTKYTGALPGIAVAIAILLRSDLRSLLRTPHLYLAAALGVAMQFPTLYWNLTEYSASFAFHLEGGLAGVDGIDEGLRRLLRVLIESLVLVSPFAVVAMGVFLVRRAGQGFFGVLHDVARWTFIVSTLTVIALAFIRDALFYWNIPAYAAFFGLAAWFMRSRVAQVLQFVYGALISTLLLVHFSIMPILPYVGLSQPDSNGFFGWQKIAAETQVAMGEQGADFPASASWGIGSRLGFAMQRPDVLPISINVNAFNYWVDNADYLGKDAVVVTEAEEDHLLSNVARYFATLEPLKTIEIERFGQKLKTYRLSLGRDYRVPEGAP